MDSTAARNRLALAAICIMVALGLLLCTGRASLAQQQAGVQAPAGPAISQRLAGPEALPGAQSRPAAPRAGRTASVAPANVAPAKGTPVSRPSGGHVQPGPAAPSGVPRTERQPPASRPAPLPPAEPGAPIGQEKPAATPGRRGPPPQRPTHAPPDPPQKPSQGAIGPIERPERAYPEKPVDRGQPPRTDQQPPPRPEVAKEPSENPRVDPRGGEDTGRPGDKGSHAQPGEPGGLPDQVGSPTENGGGGTPAQPEVQSWPGPVQEPDVGDGQPQPEVGKDLRTASSGSDGGVTNTSAGGPPSDTGLTQDTGNRATLATSNGKEHGQDARSTEAFPAPAKTTADNAAPPPAAVRGEDAEGSSGSSRVVGSAPPAAPPGGVRQPEKYRVRAASEAAFGSTEYFFGYLWDGGSYVVQQGQDGLVPMRDGVRQFADGASHGGALTQRAPPLPLPSPFSGFDLTMSGAVLGASSSSEGYVPLLAVIFCCLSTLLWRGRYRAYGALLRAGTVPRLALERPG